VAALCPSKDERKHPAYWRIWLCTTRTATKSNGSSPSWPVFFCAVYHQPQSGGVVQQWQGQIGPPADIIATRPREELDTREVVTLERLTQEDFSPSDANVAQINVTAENGHECAILIRKKRAVPRFPDSECYICRARLDDKPGLDDKHIYVDCGNCSCRVHWSCLTTWSEYQRGEIMHCVNW